MENGNYNQNDLRPTPLNTESYTKKSKVGLQILKWVGIVCGLLVVGVLLFLVWFSMESSGTFQRLKEQPQLLKELKLEYDDNSLYVDEYEANYSGIFMVDSFDYTICSKNYPNIKFVVEYSDTTFVEDGLNHNLINAKIIYKSSIQSSEKLDELKNKLLNYDIVVYPSIIKEQNLNYETEDSYFYQDSYVYTILMGNTRNEQESIRLILSSLEELGMHNFYIDLNIYEQSYFNEYLENIRNEVEPSTKRGIFMKEDKEKNSPFNYDPYGIIDYLNAIDYEIFTEYGNILINIDSRDYSIEEYYTGEHLIKQNYSISSTPKKEKTFEAKMNGTSEMVITSELNHYFDDTFTLYNTPFHIDETTYGDLEYRLYGNNKDCRFQVILERKIENGEKVLELRSDYAVNFALAEANRKIDKMVLEELEHIEILPDYISGCVDEEIDENYLLNREYLTNPIGFQNLYGTTNSVARWLYPVDYDKKQAVKEVVELLYKLGLDSYGVELVFVDDINRAKLKEEYENLEIDESLYLKLHWNGNNLYLSKDYDNIMVSYEDVLLDKVVKKEYDDFIGTFVDNSVAYNHPQEISESLPNELENEKEEINEEELDEEYRFNFD